MNETPKFIAEISANHLGSFDRAKKLVIAAANTGADYVKFQTYTADTMTLNLDTPEFTVSSDHALWSGRTLHSLYEEAHTPWEWHAELFKLARDLGIEPFSSPFDLTAVTFLEELNVMRYKIASLETSDKSLIEAVAKTGKHIIASTGASTLDEIDALVETVFSNGNKNLTLLVCTSAYPAQATDANLGRIKLLKERYGTEVGLSDHTLGTGVTVAAVALGATLIEKHLTLQRKDGGADGAFSMEPNEFKTTIYESKQASEAIGTGKWELASSEQESRRLRRSLYIVSDVAEGDLVTPENVKAIRPGYGDSPFNFDFYDGKKFSRSFKKGTPLSQDLVRE